MRATTIRELRHDTATVLGWVAAGESVVVNRRKKPVAVITPIPRKRKIVRPDFLARLRKIYGEKPLSTTGADLISESRGDS